MYYVEIEIRDKGAGGVSKSRNPACAFKKPSPLVTESWKQINVVRVRARVYARHLDREGTQHREKTKQKPCKTRAHPTRRIPLLRIPTETMT